MLNKELLMVSSGSSSATCYIQSYVYATVSLASGVAVDLYGTASTPESIIYETKDVVYVSILRRDGYAHSVTNMEQAIVEEELRFTIKDPLKHAELILYRA